MNTINGYILPEPIIDKKENNALFDLTKKYEGMIKPSKTKAMVSQVIDKIPGKVKDSFNEFKGSITEKELYLKAMQGLAKGFNFMEQLAAKYSIPVSFIIDRINKNAKYNEINSIEEICLARSYEISKLVNKLQTIDYALILAEGAGTGAAGFSGLPFNLVLSTFLYYRAVQSVAMFYGYDVKNNAAELEIASEVFMNSISPANSDSNEMSSIIGKIMLLTEVTAVKQTAKKTWAAMAERGGVTLLLTQMRALANKSAQKALEKAGQKGLEESLFKGVFEQIGKKLSKETIGKTLPYFGAFFGAAFDVETMRRVLKYANIFYNKRFIIEKEVRINTLLGIDTEDIDYESVIDISESNLETDSIKIEEAITDDMQNDEDIDF